MFKKFLKENAIQNMKTELTKMKSAIKIIHDKYYDDEKKTIVIFDPKIVLNLSDKQRDAHILEQVIKLSESESA